MPRGIPGCLPGRDSFVVACAPTPCFCDNERAHPVIRAGNLNLGPQSTSSQNPIPQSLCVLHVHSGNLFGGIERALLTCVDNLQFAPSLRFEFALCFEGKFAESLRRTGQPVHRLPQVRTRNPLSIFTARRALWHLLQSNRYDTVVCHSPWSHSMFAPVVAQAHLPGIFWAHNHLSGRHWLEKWASRTPPAFVISNSHYTDRSVPKIFSEVPHRVLYCPANLRSPKLTPDNRSCIRSQFQTPADAVVLIQVSRPEPGKGHALLLDAAAKLGNERNWFVWFVGGAQRSEEANYLHSLRQQAQQMGIADRVRFAGERDDIPQLMAAADVFCHPNLFPESFGLVFIEALAVGLPVLTFDMGGASEIVKEDCGILVQPRDKKSFDAELQRLVFVSSIRRRLSSCGPARSHELCDPARILPELERIITKVVITNPGS